MSTHTASIKTLISPTKIRVAVFEHKIGQIKGFMDLYWSHRVNSLPA